MSRRDTIVRQIVTALGRGEFGRPGDRFITVRQLATEHGVSLVTAQRIVRRLKELGWLVSDSTHAAKISTKISEAITPRGDTPRRLGMIVTNIANPFFSQLCRHVQHEAAAAGYQLLMAGSHYNFQREKKAVESFLEIGVEGLLIAPGVDAAAADMYRRLAERDVAMVFISRFLEDVPADYVTADSFLGSASVAAHFVNLGYDSFGYIGFASRLTRDARLSGFRSALWEAGLSIDAPATVHAEGGNIEHGFQAMDRLMHLLSPPRAVFAYHDLLAIGAMAYCHEHGISVPDDVAIAGFDNLPQSHVTRPGLTTVSYPIESMARLAVDCVTDYRKNTGKPRPPHRILLAPELVIRRSTNPKALPISGVVDPGYRLDEIL